MLKGHAKIELTDVREGTTKVIEEDNMFTNIFEDLINDNGFGLTALSSSPGTFLPPSTAALGGIVIFENTQTENVNNKYPSEAPVAYAGNSTDAGTDTKKGTYNPTESGEVTGGYKHVWDFTTSQGNGTIRCLCLTHPVCANSWPSNVNHIMRDARIGYPSWLSNCFMIDAGQRLFAGYNPSTSHIEVRKLKAVLNSLPSVMTKLLESAPSEIVLDIEPASDTDRSHAAAGMVWWINGNTATGYGHSGGSYIYTLTINLTTLEYTESSFTVEGQSIAGFGNYMSYAAVRNGYLYCIGSGGAICKINLSNTSDVSTLDVTTSFLGYDSVLDWIILSKTHFLYPDDTLGTGASFNNGDTYYTPYRGIARIGSKEAVVTHYNQWNDRHTLLRIITPKSYLATINNLAEPLIKTSAQTMKISYTIYDYDEEQSSTSNASAGGTNAVSTDVTVGSD